MFSLETLKTSLATSCPVNPFSVLNGRLVTGRVTHILRKVQGWNHGLDMGGGSAGRYGRRGHGGPVRFA